MSECKVDILNFYFFSEILKPGFSLQMFLVISINIIIKI
jgi:hypothetical protein